MTRAVCLVALALLAFPLPASAQAIVADRVSDEATEGNSQRKLARDGSGGIHLAYVKPSGGFDQVFVASSTDGGKTWRSTAVTRRSVHSRYPALAVEPGGTLHLVWTTYEPVGHVYYARRADGQWSNPVKVSPGDAYAGVPALAVASDGQVHLVWYGIRNQAPQVVTRHGSIYEILYSGLAGNQWSLPVVISPGVPDSINAALAVDASGTLHSAWYQFDMRAYQVQYARRRGRWELPHRITSGTADAFAVSLALGPDGRAYVVWERRASSGVEILFVAGPDPWSAPAAISTGGAAYNPTVAVDRAGRVFVAWESDGRLYLRRRDGRGRWLNLERITEEGTNQHPIIAASGDAVDLAWTQEVAGDHRVRFAPVAGRPGGPRGGGSVGFLLLVLIAALLWWQLRRRQRLVR